MQHKQGTHGDEHLGDCDVLLPGATFVEKEGLYVNTEGRPQRCVVECVSFFFSSEEGGVG